ncbi:MAG TPA: trypsin-like peptidase domain-containing protein [Gemmataceae bacterium]|nr:trypsin-like peptidase domain-containing protein [Gemmataceae bacterium]
MKRCSLILCCLVLGGLAGIFLAGPLLQGQAPVAPAIPKELTSYRDVVKKVLPAVVSIDSHAKVKPVRQDRRRNPLDERIPEEFRRFFDFNFDGEDEAPAPQGGFGSGFVIDAKGVILTNFHVVDGAGQVTVQLSDGRKFNSKDVKTDPKTDLAIVRIEAPAALPFLELGDSDAMEPGDRVLAIGAPFGLTGTVTHGIISGKDRSLQLNMYEDFLQTDAAINPGNSGGPLVSLDGKVIGINSAIKSRSGGWQGVGLAVSSNIAKTIVPQLLKDGVVHRGYLGVQIKDLTEPDIASRLGVQQGEHGVLVTRVFEDTPGAKAGLKEGDVLTTLDGKPVHNGRELQMLIARLPVGKSVEVRGLRDGQAKTFNVTIEEQPNKFGTTRVPLPRRIERDEPDSISIDKIGVDAIDLTPDVADSLGYREQSQGALIASVKRDSPADEGGLRRGMLITKVDKKPVKSAKDLRDAVEAASLGKGILLQIETPQGGTNYVLLKSSRE